MDVGTRLRQIRTLKKLSQGDVEKRTGLLRCYTSRVENGFTVPAIETLEKYARAYEVELFQLFYDGNGKPNFIPANSTEKLSKPHRLLIGKIAGLLPKVSDRDGKLLLATVRQMARK